MKMETDIVITKGVKLFTSEGARSIIQTLEYADMMNEAITHMATLKIYADKYSGREFLQLVKDGVITNEDGSVVLITLDDYETNLGLYYPNGTDDSFVAGKFLMTPKFWKELLMDHDVQVYWANN